MARIARLLVHVDPAAVHDPAVEAAVRLAESCRGRVTLVDVVSTVPQAARRFVTARVEAELVEHRRQLLSAMAARLRFVRAAVLVLRGSTAEALIREAARGPYDMLVRAHARKGGAGKPFGTLDMRLLRRCPCPVWLVGPPLRARSGPVVAAVQAGATDRTTAALNARIIDLAGTMSEFLGVPLVLLHAWSAFGEGALYGHLSARQIATYVERSRAQAQDDMNLLAAEARGRFPDAEVALVKGPPERVIPSFALRRGAALVVMGTVGRSGLAGAVIGNTAERVLGALRGSVLAVKPFRRGRGR